jgi:hypothetical protein
LGSACNGASLRQQLDLTKSGIKGEVQEMEARNTLGRSRISTSVIVTFAVALLAALLLGGAGGYLVRTAISPASSKTGTPVDVRQTYSGPQQPVVPDWVYRRPSAQPTLPQETTDPNGNVIRY